MDRLYYQTDSLSSILADSFYAVSMRMQERPFGEWLRDEIDRKGWIPAMLADALGVPDGTVARWLNGARVPSSASCKRIAAALGVDPDLVLAHAGHRDRRDNPAQDAVIQQQRQEINRLRSDLDESQIRLEVTPIGRDIPVVGRVPADSIRWTDDEGLDPVRVLEDDLKGARLPVGLLVTGDCMRAIGILPGDVVIVDRNVDRDPHSGELVVIRVGGEYTLKRWHRDGNRIELRDGDGALVATLSPLDEYSIEAFYITYKPLAKR